jgi:hypothetical protein
MDPAGRPEPSKLDELSELLRTASAATGAMFDQVYALEIVRHLATITPPMISVEEEKWRYIETKPVGLGGGISIKPGNVRLNIHALVSAVAKGAFTVVSVAHLPWMAPLGAMVLWDALYSTTKVPLSENDACVVWAMWLNCDGKHTLPEAGALEMVNRERREHGQSHLSEAVFDDSINTLQRMKCIERWSSDPSRWWLREWVNVKYD